MVPFACWFFLFLVVYFSTCTDVRITNVMDMYTYLLTHVANLGVELGWVALG